VGIDHRVRVAGDNGIDDAQCLALRVSPKGLIEANLARCLAKREGVDNSYVSRMVNLTTLAPDIVAAILDDTLPGHITLLELAADPPVLWGEKMGRVTPCC
jgi:hypothetical protein